MLLCVDIGNTNISLGLFRGEELVHDWRMRTDARMTADELALGMRGMLGPLADQVTGVSALSTVPAVLRELRVMLGRYYGDVPRIVFVDADNKVLDQGEDPAHAPAGSGLSSGAEVHAETSDAARLDALLQAEA